MLKFEEADRLKALYLEAHPLDQLGIRQVKEYFRDRCVWSSNAVEGNTLTLDETSILIEDGITIGGHTIREMHEALGGAAAYDHMYDLIGQTRITEDDIKTFHRLFASQIPDIDPGEYRTVNVFVRGSSCIFPDHQKVPGLMADFITWMMENRKKYHPIEFAARAHIRFVCIHPFRDGNGRVSRLLMNTILLQNKFIPVMIEPIHKNWYNECIQNVHLGKPEYRNKFSWLIDERETVELQGILRTLRVDYGKEQVPTQPAEE